MKYDRMKEIHIFIALGIDLEGNKTILGFWINDESKSKGTWPDIFQDLINWGLKRVALFVTNDFPGVKDIISKPYPIIRASTLLGTFHKKSKDAFIKGRIR